MPKTLKTEINMKIKHLYIDEDLTDNLEAERIGRNLGLKAQILPNRDEVYRLIANDPDPVSAGKEHLILTANRGAFIKECPGTRDYICCGYQILHIGTFCTMDCSYCILQAYFHPPVMQYFINYADMEAELAKLFDKGEIFRIGTGEFTDSLIWEPWTQLSDRLVPLFGAQKHGVLELKTKTTEIGRLKDLPHNGKVVLAWSLNTPRIIKEQERNTAGLLNRLEAAKTAQSWGYNVALHFDPLVLYEGSESEYTAVIDSIFDMLNPAQIAWISLGSFRCMPELKNVIEQRFPKSKLPYGEFITGQDAKLRYFKPLRLKLYKRLVEHIKQRGPGVFAYFCMEDPEIWQAAFGFNPEERGGLSHMLDCAIKDMCGLV